MGHFALPITSSLRMHAAAWSSGHPWGVRKSGTSATHLSTAYGQRGANLQPGGGFIRFGGDPAIGVRRSPGFLSLGIELSNPSVYGWAGLSYMSRILPVSAMRPEYMILLGSRYQQPRPSHG